MINPHNLFGSFGNVANLAATQSVDAIQAFNLSAEISNSKVLRGRLDLHPPPSDRVSWWLGDGDATDIAGSNNGVL